MQALPARHRMQDRACLQIAAATSEMDLFINI